MIVAYVPDLMDRSKVAAAAEVTFVARPAELADVDAQLVLVDLSRPGVLEVLPSIAARTIGFAGHLERELLEAARAAGCDEVMPRSKFFSGLAQLLAP